MARRLKSREPTQPAHLRAGSQGEVRALEHLADAGLILVERNYRTRRGELDLIMLDGEVLAFIEVRYRAAGAAVSPEESVTGAKQRRLVAAAEHYLVQHREMRSRRCRFDVVALSGDGPVRWIRRAFDA